MILEQNTIIDLINQKVNELKWLDCFVYKFQSNCLTIVGSEDFTYFHNFEILFREVHFYSGIFNWKWDFNENTKFIDLIEDINLEFQINKKFQVEQGNLLFKLANQDNLEILIGCKSVEFSDKITKYF